MPRGDGTGPMGMGPRTGRGMGYCTGYNTPGYMNGYGFGLHRGFRNMFYATVLPGYARYNYNVDETSYLKSEAKYLEDQLKYINDRLDDIEKKDNRDNKEDK